MTRRVSAYVHIAGRVFAPGDEVPEEIAERITNPAAWAEPTDADDAGGQAGAEQSSGGQQPTQPPPQFDRGGVLKPVPPMSGSGSGRDAWADYAAAAGVTVADDAKRDQIVEILRERGVPVTPPENKE